MEYEHIWKKALRDDETVQYEFSLSKKYRNFYLVLFSIIGLFFMLGSFPTGVIILLLVFFYFGFYLRVSNAYALTDKRVLIHRGWLSTNATSIEYQHITDVTVQEPFLERIITKSGDLSINTAGTSAKEVVLKHIATPYEVRKKIDEIRK
jgi:uncharacterized membrane protein YdbT with pleckstrin-like domain